MLLFILVSQHHFLAKCKLRQLTGSRRRCREVPFCSDERLSRFVEEKWRTECTAVEAAKISASRSISAAREPAYQRRVQMTVSENQTTTTKQGS